MEIQIDAACLLHSMVNIQGTMRMEHLKQATGWVNLSVDDSVVVGAIPLSR
jgi:hypothetical protein